jgi:hypothetical protein
MDDDLPYVCPQCGDSSPVAVLCDRCARPMTARGATPPAPPATWGARLTLATGAFLGGTAGAALAFALMFFERTFFGAFLFFSVGFLPVVAAGVLGARVGRRIASNSLREARSAWQRAEADARLDALPLRELAACDGGVVRVRGRVHAAQPLYGLGNTPCVAIEMVPHGEPLAEPRHSTGSTFSLVDAAGVRAVVRAEHVMIAEGEQSEYEVVVPVDADVEVRGVARRLADAASPSNTYRAVASALEFVGTPEEPVVIRVLRAREPAAR